MVKHLEGLVEDIVAGGRSAEEASLQLGLLVERAKKRLPDEQYRGLIARGLMKYHPTQAELDRARVLVGEFVAAAKEPLPRTVWALAKFYDPDALTPVASLLPRILGEGRHEELSAACVDALIECWDDNFEDVLEEVAQRDSGKAGAKAKAWLSAIRRGR